MSGWDSYWQDSNADLALTGPGGQPPQITAFWESVFADIPATALCLDIASGSGAVIQSANDFFADRMPHYSGQDLSADAIAQLKQRFPGIEGIVSDAKEIPRPDAGFDLVTSQFGIEYAGQEAFPEAARLVKPGGRLALLVHCRPGLIYNECAESLTVIDKLRAARFFPLASSFLAAGFKAAAGGDRRAYEKAHKQFKPAFRVLERALAKHGPKVASGLLQRLATDLAAINRKLQNYDGKEVLAWLARLSEELTAYRARMHTMQDAALPTSQLGAIRQFLIAGGFVDLDDDEMDSSSQDQRLAVALNFQRSESGKG